MEHKDIRELKDVGLSCPACGFEKMGASDSFCWRCAKLLPEDWVAKQA